ncbi:hypothetical protein Lesp02_68950 [Lentzea sp. NBRC 105346]|uniref:tetratricopeptide repeat protein n=1 Tax=Lentzea sp. NBRC 105346 TaxID=3032205 RepID=UPI0024A5671C|nr:tetratricopeptide repeat protein [Lentzea sp. NBRC 105346]GLZ34708.1 hypothetical protein Lesp02_68950 [Lentzea sp. NBRC 105346]
MGNVALRRLLAESGLSNGALARAIIAMGAKEGLHLATTTTSVKRMLDGAQPRWPVPRLVAKALTMRLGYQVGIEDCGFVDRSPVGDTFDGCACSPTAAGTIAIVVELSWRDMNRRNFLMGSAFTAAAFAQPAWLALTVPPDHDRSHEGGARIGSPDVEVLKSMVRQFELLHRRHGGGVSRPHVVQFVHHQARAALHGSYSDKVGRELYSAVAQATWLAGLNTVDSGRHALGQRYYTQALNLALHAGDRLYAANVLAEMSRVTIEVGQVSGAVSDAQNAAGLARSALQVANGRATPALGAYLHAIEARGLALLGDAKGTAKALDDARRSFEREGDEPDWMSFYGESDLMSDIGQCLRDTGRPQQGVAMLERALAGLPEHRVTARAKTQIHIAAAYVELGDYDGADHVAGEALQTIGGLSSSRIVERVKSLRRRANRRHADLDERIAGFLA